MSELFVAGIFKALEWVVIGFIEIVGVFYGVKWAFRSDRRWENQRFQKRVREIVPHIYIELSENFGFLQRYQGYSWFYQNSIRLKTTHWEIFQSELAKWQEQNVVPLTRIYHNLTRINKNVDARIEMSKIDFVTMSFETKN